jgi:hypothetical protein
MSILLYSTTNIALRKKKRATIGRTREKKKEKKRDDGGDQQKMTIVPSALFNIFLFFGSFFSLSRSFFL